MYKMPVDDQDCLPDVARAPAAGHAEGGGGAGEIEGGREGWEQDDAERGKKKGTKRKTIIT